MTKVPLNGPLTGIRVLDLTNVLAGPFATHQLCQMGAEVIKIEMPGRGDLARQLGQDRALNEARMGVSFLAQNAGKKSVTLDLKSTRGQEIFHKLLATSDVLVENFRPGVMDRLGLGANPLRAKFPDLIYCALSGYGQTGPWKDRPAYDQIVQGVSGAMDVTGQSDGDPLRVGYPVADTVGGLTAALAVASALNARPRGCVIDVSMLESTMATMAWAISNYLIAGKAPERLGNDNPTASPSGAFKTADGYLNIAANEDKQWRALAGALGRADLIAHPSFANRDDRKANRVALTGELEQTLTQKPTSHWIEVLSPLGVPVGEIMTVPDMLAHPQVADRQMIKEHQGEIAGRSGVRTVTTGMKFDGEPPQSHEPPPKLGQHNDEILGSIGIDEKARRQLRKAGII